MGVKIKKPNQVCKLIKSLYSLKQASRKWHEKSTSLLIHNGYTQTPSNHAFFTKSTTSSFTLLLVYVDDVILASNSLFEFSTIKEILHTYFQIKNLGQLKYFLGLEVAHSKVFISIYLPEKILFRLTFWFMTPWFQNSFHSIRYIVKITSWC